ncbi:hypothetical protein ABFX02_08G226700 [Erythranthe guttata]
MAWFWQTISAIVIILVIWIIQKFLTMEKKKKKKQPPGPIGLPIIGHFHLLGKNPHQDLHRLSAKHGPIMHLRLGFLPTVVVSSPAGAELFLKTHDLVFAGRPLHQAAKHMVYDGRDIAFGQYGSYWRDIRKLCTLNLLSSHKINQFRHTRKAELSLFVGSLRRAACQWEAVDVSKMITGLSWDMICMTVFGRKFADSDLDETKGFKSVIEDILHLVAIPNLGDFFPYVGWLDLQGLTRRMKQVHNSFDGFLEKVIEDHGSNNQENTKKDARDFVDTMMAIMDSGEAGFDLDRRHVKAVLADMLIGGTDTTAVTTDWALAELIRHPQIMNKLQQELEQVVGMDQYVDESHLEKLDYLDLVIKETFRLHPIVPLLNHKAMQDCTVDEFHIPKGTRIIVNLLSISRDPNVWQEPEKFSPERFVGIDTDYRGMDFRFIPFGSGRRMCPGIHLGLTSLRLMLAQLVHCFDWELPNGTSPNELNMAEHFGLVTSRDEHLMAIPIYRLHK